MRTNVGAGFLSKRPARPPPNAHPATAAPTTPAHTTACALHPVTTAPALQWSRHTAASPADSTESPAPTPAPPDAGCWRVRTDTLRATTATPANWQTPPAPRQSSRVRRSCSRPTSAYRPTTNKPRPTRPSLRQTTPPTYAQPIPANPSHWPRPGFPQPLE